MRKRILFFTVMSFIFFVSNYLATAQEKPEEMIKHDKDGGVTMVITATKSRHLLKQVPVQTNVITKKEIESAGVKDAGDALKLIPGMEITAGARFGNNDRKIATIRGLPAGYNLVLIDGRRVKSEHIHTGVNLSIIPIEMVDRIEVVKDAGSAIYGSDAFGGVINIITKPLPDQKLLDINSDYGTYGTKGLGVNLGGPINNFGYFLGLKARESDGISGNWYKQNNVLLKTGLQLKGSALSFTGGYYQNDYPNSGIPVTDKAFDTAISWKKELNEISLLNIGGYFTTFNSTLKDKLNQTSNFDCTYNTSLLHKHFITTGIELRNEEFERVSTSYKNQLISAFFLEDEFKISAPFTLLAAARLDSYEGLPVVFTPKAGVMYSLNPETTLRASAGKGYRAPSLMDLYEYHYTHRAYWRDGNPDLKPEYLDNYSAGIERDFKEGLISTYFQLFRNDLTNMITSVNTGVIDSGLPVFKRENIKSASVQGAEAGFKYTLERWEMSLGYIAVDSRDNNGNLLSYTPKNTARAMLGYSFTEIKLNINITGEMATERYYSSGGLQKQLEDYRLLNINLTENIYKELNLSFRIDNAFDERYQNYGEEGSILSGYGRTYNLGINYKFF
ncbi:MAG: hypothetical protein A3J83_00870 [Elusimicrobia bacterium RIFOXYA2_FULL_40_6]|nr:MAG: hypothetical protein A3J83_00870 [Elusimicrobia bacterium RIFOXYA2_FULL_40_6]